MWQFQRQIQKLHSLGTSSWSTMRLWQSTVATNVPTDSVQVSEAREWAEARPYSEIPGDSLFTLLLKMLPGGRYHNLDFSQLHLAMRAKFGDILLMPPMIGSEAVLTTHNPKDFERVYRNEGIWPERLSMKTLVYHREQHRADFFQGIGGLMTTQDKIWGDFRSAVNPVLMQPKNVRLYFQKMAQVSSEFVECIKRIRDSQTLETPDNFLDYINRWTLESVSVVGLNRQLDLLKSDNADPRAILLFKSLNEFFVGLEALEMKPSPWRYITTPKFTKLMRALDNITDVTAGFVEEALQRLEKDAKRGITRPENEQSVLEKLLKIDRKLAMVMVMDMLLAGVDTTSSTFVSVLLCLAKHPEKQQKLREEVRRILPQKDSEFTEAALLNAPYMRACIKESMRLHPLVTTLMRTTQRDCVLSGYRVPKGTHVAMVPLTLLQNPQYFAQPHEFLPERWLRGQDGANQGVCPVKSIKATNPFVFLPFGFGPRMCIGKRIVDLEVELSVAQVIRNFNVEFNYSTENAFKTVLINLPNIPLNFKFTDTPN